MGWTQTTTACACECTAPDAILEYKTISAGDEFISVNSYDSDGASLGNHTVLGTGCDATIGAGDFGELEWGQGMFIYHDRTYDHEGSHIGAIHKNIIQDGGTGEASNTLTDAGNARNKSQVRVSCVSIGAGLTYHCTIRAVTVTVGYHEDGTDNTTWQSSISLPAAAPVPPARPSFFVPAQCRMPVRPPDRQPYPEPAGTWHVDVRYPTSATSSVIGARSAPYASFAGLVVDLQMSKAGFHAYHEDEPGTPIPALPGVTETTGRIPVIYLHESYYRAGWRRQPEVRAAPVPDRAAALSGRTRSERPQSASGRFCSRQCGGALELHG